VVGKETVLLSSDNSGVVYAKCIGLASSLNLNEFVLGSVITVMPKILNPRKKLKKKKYLGLIVALRKITTRPQGIRLRFGANRLMVLAHNYAFQGTRVYGPICREIRTKLTKARYRKIISYSQITI